MISYKLFRPTQFDSAGLALSERQGWLVAPVSRTRDSDTLEESNFRSFLKALGGESESVEVHRFGHWGPGWFEIILIDPADGERVRIAEEIASDLENYPVVDEADFSELEYEQASERWRQASLRERYEIVTARYCQGVSVFAIRRDELPSDRTGELVDYLGK